MAISFVNVGTTNAPGANITVNATMPASTASGDILILDASINKATTFTTPSGWTLLDSMDETAMIHRICWKVATGSDSDPTCDFGVTGQIITHIAAYRGVDNSTPFIAHAGTNNTGSSSVNCAAPSITNTDAGAWAVGSYSARQIVTPSSFTPPSGMTERADVDSGNGTSANMASCFDDTNGTVGTGSVTYTAVYSGSTAQSTSWAAFLLPATGGGGPTPFVGWGVPM